MDIILSLLQATTINRVGRSLFLTTNSGQDLQFHAVRFHVEADEKLQLIHNWTHQLLPIILEGSLNS